MFMEFERGFLAACAETLRQIDSGEPPAPPEAGSLSSLDKRTQAFLNALGYLPGRNAEVPDPETRHNRLALTALSGWFDRAFQLPMRHAPGAFFFGGQLSPASFALSTARNSHLGVAGRGLSLQQAFESCAGEAAERLSLHEWPGDREPPAVGRPRDRARIQIRMPRAGDRLMTGADFAWARAQLGLAADSDPGTLDSVEAVSLIDGERLLLPAALCLLPGPGRQGVPKPAGSTGCAAGPSVDAASLSALEELVERDSVTRWWHGETAPRPVAPELLQELGIEALAQRVRAGSPRRHWFLDITGPLGIPSFVALSADPDGLAVVAGYGASLDPQRALSGALLELCQAELAQELALMKRQQRGEKALNAADRRWIEQHEQVSLESHGQFQAEGTARPSAGETEARSLAATLARLAEAGHDAYRVDLSRRPLGIKVARVVVPGLETSLPSWTALRPTDRAQEAAGGRVRGSEPNGTGVGASPAV